MTEHETMPVPEPVPGFSLDPALVKRFVAGSLDEPGQAELADQVSHLIAFHSELPNALVAKLARIMKHLGGEAELVAWLESFPGRPRTVARLFALIELLDRFSAEPAVVAALAELRAGTPDPPGMAAYLSPDTNDETLSGLAWHIESLVADDRLPDAVRLALDAAALLAQILRRATELDPEVPDLAGLVDRARDAIAETADAVAVQHRATGP
jgi:MoxR-like ATPase